jgi:thiamine-phosphate pyrophosphorylase
MTAEKRARKPCQSSARLRYHAGTMAERPKRAEPRPAPRLYLVTPRLDETAGFDLLLAQALDAGDVAAVLLRLADADERSLINRAKALCPVAQDKGAALLLDGRADLVARAGCDGAHLTGLAAFTEALDRLKPDRIAGCGGLATRHDAMVAAEAGADYVMFGEPDETGARPSFAAVEERVAWWAEVFEFPCVGYAASPAEVRPLAEAGADFVALGDWLWRDPQGAVAVAARDLKLPETTP